MLDEKTKEIITAINILKNALGSYEKLSNMEREIEEVMREKPDKKPSKEKNNPSEKQDQAMFKNPRELILKYLETPAVEKEWKNPVTDAYPFLGEAIIPFRTIYGLNNYFMEIHERNNKTMLYHVLLPSVKTNTTDIGKNYSTIKNKEDKNALPRTGKTEEQEGVVTKETITIPLKKHPLHAILLSQETLMPTVKKEAITLVKKQGNKKEKIRLTTLSNPRLVTNKNTKGITKLTTPYLHSNEEVRKEMEKIFSDIMTLLEKDADTNTRTNNKNDTKTHSKNRETTSTPHNKKQPITENHDYKNTYAYQVLLDETNPFIYLDQDTLKTINTISILNTYAYRHSHKLDEIINEQKQKILEIRHPLSLTDTKNLNYDKLASDPIAYLYNRDTVVWIANTLLNYSLSKQTKNMSNKKRREKKDTSKNNAEKHKETNKNNSHGEKNTYTAIYLQALQQAITNSVLHNTILRHKGAHVLSEQKNEASNNNETTKKYPMTWDEALIRRNKQHPNNNETINNTEEKETRKTVIAIRPLENSANIQTTTIPQTQKQEQKETTTLEETGQLIVGLDYENIGKYVGKGENERLKTVIDTVQSCVELEQLLGQDARKNQQIREKNEHGKKPQNNIVSLGKNGVENETNRLIVIKKTNDQHEFIGNQKEEENKYKLTPVGNYKKLLSQEEKEIEEELSKETNNLLIASEYLLLKSDENGKQNNPDSFPNRNKVTNIAKEITTLLERIAKIRTDYIKNTKHIQEVLGMLRKCSANVDKNNKQKKPRKTDNNEQNTGKNNDQECKELIAELPSVIAKIRELVTNEANQIEKLLREEEAISRVVKKRRRKKQRPEPIEISHEPPLKRPTQYLPDEIHETLDKKPLTIKNATEYLELLLAHRRKYVWGELHNSDTLGDLFERITSGLIDGYVRAIGLSKGVIIDKEETSRKMSLSECNRQLNRRKNKNKNKNSTLNDDCDTYPSGIEHVGIVTNDEQLAKIYILDAITTRTINSLSKLIDFSSQVPTTNDQALITMNGTENTRETINKIDQFINNIEEKHKQLLNKHGLLTEFLFLNEAKRIIGMFLTYPECFSLEAKEYSLGLVLDPVYECLFEKIVAERGHKELARELQEEQKKTIYKEYYDAVQSLNNYYEQLEKTCPAIITNTKNNKKEPEEPHANETETKKHIHVPSREECERYVTTKQRLATITKTLLLPSKKLAEQSITNTIKELAKQYQKTKQEPPSRPAEKQIETVIRGMEKPVSDYAESIVSLEKNTEEIVRLKAEKTLKYCKNVLPFSMKKYAENIVPLTEVFAHPLKTIKHNTQTQTLRKKETSKKEKTLEQSKTTPIDSYALWWIEVLEKQLLLGEKALNIPLRRENGRNTFANIPEKTMETYAKGVKTPVEHLKNAHKATILAKKNSGAVLKTYEITSSIAEIIPTIPIGMYPSKQQKLETRKRETLTHALFHSYEYFLTDPLADYEQKHLNQYKHLKNKPKKENSNLLKKYSEIDIRKQAIPPWEDTSLLKDIAIMTDAIAKISIEHVDKKTNPQKTIQKYWEAIETLLTTQLPTTIQEKIAEEKTTNQRFAKKIRGIIHKHPETINTLPIPITTSIKKPYGSPNTPRKTLTLVALNNLITSKNKEVNKPLRYLETTTKKKAGPVKNNTKKQPQQQQTIPIQLTEKKHSLLKKIITNRREKEDMEIASLIVSKT